MPINDDTIKALKKAIADAFNSQLPKTLKGKARKKSIKGNTKMGNDLGVAIKSFILEAEVETTVDLGEALLDGSIELLGTGATIPPIMPSIDPTEGDPVEVEVAVSGSILTKGTIIEG